MRAIYEAGRETRDIEKMRKLWRAPQIALHFIPSSFKYGHARTVQQTPQSALARCCFVSHSNYCFRCLSTTSTSSAHTHGKQRLCMVVSIWRCILLFVFPSSVASAIGSMLKLYAARPRGSVDGLRPSCVSISRWSSVLAFHHTN